MNAEQVVEKILSQAKAEAEAILREARHTAASQKARLESELAEFDKKTDDLARAAAADKLQRMLAAARMDNARRLLACRVAILDEVFDRAKKAVNGLSDEAYQALMASMMKKAVETGDEEVIIGKGEKRINDALLKRINSDSGGAKGNLRLSDKQADITGGFILSCGRVQKNASTDVMIDRLRESMQIELANELF
ncbi:MAG: V-type ATP synthase subunit E [Planctomycetales bacterium]|nr:V-type ATP synthase subunit E [Planctomycetales bacterium]